LTINISGLSTPALADLSSNLGNLPFTVSTAKAGGSLTVLGSSPSALVLIPIQTIRAAETDGTPTHNGKVVSVEGVCTDTLTATGTAPAFLQDGEHGVTIFSAASTKVFTQATRYAVAGTVGSFNGLTQVNPLSLSAIVEVGAGTLPTPRLITLPLSFADAELYEGSLVQIANVSKASSETDFWGASKTITVTDGTNPIDIRIQVNSTATTEPGYPATITGILGQYDTSLPRTSGYQIMPRTPEDLSFAPELTISSSQADYGESDGPFAGTLTIGRRGSAVGTLSVTISASVIGRVTIQDSADLVTIEFADGQVSKTVDLGIVDDSIVSPSSQVVLSVISVPDGAATSSSVSINITDNDTDTTKPVITLLGANPLLIANGATYTDPGATVTDNMDATRTIQGTGTVNTAAAGDYTITYNATDTAGNAAIAVLRTVRVAAPLGTTYSGWLNGAGASDAAFLDYVFGAATPGTLDPSLRPTVAVTGGNLVLTYYVRQGTLGLTVTPKTSADLAAGSSGWVTTDVTVDNVGAAREVNGVSVQQKTASVPVSGAKKFLRVEAVQE
jgi:ABC-type molybdate transport system substrate-binding protein